MNLTHKQKALLFFAAHNRGAGTGDYYCELGSCKPWRKSTVNSLVNKGLAEVVKKYDSAVELRLTDVGRRHAPLAMPLMN